MAISEEVNPNLTALMEELEMKILTEHGLSEETSLRIISLMRSLVATNAEMKRLIEGMQRLIELYKTNQKEKDCGSGL